MLEDASIKLSAVASSVTTVSARQMLAAMVAGERDAKVLADMARRNAPQNPGPDRGVDRGTSMRSTPSWSPLCCTASTTSNGRWASSTR